MQKFWPNFKKLTIPSHSNFTISTYLLTTKHFFSNITQSKTANYIIPKSTNSFKKKLPVYKKNCSKFLYPIPSSTQNSFTLFLYWPKIPLPYSLIDQKNALYRTPLLTKNQSILKNSQFPNQNRPFPHSNNFFVAISLTLIENCRRWNKKLPRKCRNQFKLVKICEKQRFFFAYQASGLLFN